MEREEIAKLKIRVSLKEMRLENQTNLLTCVKLPIAYSAAAHNPLYTSLSLTARHVSMSAHKMNSADS